MPITIQSARPEQWQEVAHLIFHSTNAWYEKNRGFQIFAGDPDALLFHCRTYAALDGAENLLIAWDTEKKQIVGSCFVHPRSTHMALGILNVHPSSFGDHVASRLVSFIAELARQRKQPLRLVSSAMNLDSFSTYSRLGFVPYTVYQDMMIPDFQPEKALLPAEACALLSRLRPASLADVPAIDALERELTGLDHVQDYTYFIRNSDGAWHTWVIEGDSSSGPCVEAVLSSVLDPASCMLGPGLMRNQAQMLALIHTAYAFHKNAGSTPVFLVPSTCSSAIQTLYRWGARNTEIHVGQCLSLSTNSVVRAPAGLVMPTFMPES